MVELNHKIVGQREERELDMFAKRCLELGDQVTVAMSAGNGRLAVVLAFVVPFFILIAVLVLCLWITGDEAMAALMGIASLVPYYVVLHFLEKRISRQFAFVIE